MNPMNLLSGFANVSKWVFGGAAGLYAANRIQTGSAQNLGSDAAEMGVEIQSGAQAQNGNIDTFFAGRNKLQGIIGFLSGLFAAIAKATGSETMAKWSRSLTEFRANEQAVIQNEIRNMGQTSVSTPGSNNDPIMSTLTGPQVTGDGNLTAAAGLAGGVATVGAAGWAINRLRGGKDHTVTALTQQRDILKLQDEIKGLRNGTVVGGAAGATDDAARAFTTVADDAARFMTPDEIARAARGLDNGAALADDATRAGIGLADDAARAGMSLGGRAKIVGAALVGIGATYSWITGENPVVRPANAAVDPTAPVDTSATPTPESDLATGAPVEASLIAGSGAVVAATSLGVKAIPLVGGVVTAADTLWNTGSYLFQGEFSKAGTELVAGAGLTLGATGGFLTYGLGEAWHAGVRDGAIAVIGEDAEIGKAPLRSVFEMTTGVNTDMATAPAATPTVEAFRAAVANSEIRVPEAMTMEYDAMGSATGYSAPATAFDGTNLGDSFGSAKAAPPAVAADTSTSFGKRRTARTTGWDSNLH